MKKKIHRESDMVEIVQELGSESGQATKGTWRREAQVEAALETLSISTLSINNI